MPTRRRSLSPVPPNYRLQAMCADDDDAPGTPCGNDTLPEWRRAAAIAVAAPADPVALADAVQPVDAAATLTILSPKPNIRVIRNPELPADLASLPLKAAATPDDAQVTWFVDGKPFAVTAAKDVTRWPLQPGTHTFTAELAYRHIAAKPVTIEVQ